MTLPSYGFGPLIAAFIAVTAVLMVLCLTARLSWQAKATLIGLGAAAQLASYFAWPPLLGWPSRESLPRKFSLVAVHIQEPSQFIQTAGEVYFWVMDLNAGGTPQPRAYTLPFTPELKATAADAAGKLRKNIAQEGQFIDEEEVSLVGVPPEEGEGSALKSRKFDLRFSDVSGGGPPPKAAELPAEAPPAP